MIHTQRLLKHRTVLTRTLSLLIIITLIQHILGSIPIALAQATEPNLTITPITWNVIGLDSNNVNVGPNNFPVGARVCNTGAAVIGDLVANFVWDDGGDLFNYSGSYINLRDGSLSSIKEQGLAAGTVSTPTCTDFYFEVSVDRNKLAYETTRRFHIAVSSAAGTPEFSPISTPKPREIFVEYLISQNRNSTNLVSYALGTGMDPSTLTPVLAGGTLNLMVGSTYTIKLDASTATQGYNQLENFINFPNTIFQINKVSSYYSANSSGYISNSSDFLYADACLWDMNPESPTYHSCIGSNGKTGGTIQTIYEVTVIAGAGTTQSLNTLIYDFSGSSFHYNSDFSASKRFITIDSALTLSKSFSPASISPDGISLVSILIGNTSPAAVSGVSITDTLPSGLTISGTPASPQCDGIVSYTTDTITLSDATIPTTGCTLLFNVTAAAKGAYTNTTNSLYILDVDTGITASANLMVETAPIASGTCATPVTIAQWTIPTTGTTPPTATTVASGATALAFTNSTQNTIDSGWWRIGDQISSPTIDLANNKYYRFEITTADYSSTKLTFSYVRGNGGPQALDLYASNSTNLIGTTPTKLASFLPTQTTQTITNLSVDVNSLANASGETYFYLVAYNAAGNSGGTNWIGINNISLTGCPPAQTIEKSFTPDPILVGGTSTLTFTLRNYTAAAISNVDFSDTLPNGLEVASTPNISSSCGVDPSIDSLKKTINLSGGTIPALTATPGSGTCQISVDVTATKTGVLPNTSGYLSISGINLDSKASDSLTVLEPPIITKSFSPNPIYAGMISTLTFNLSNPNSDTELTGLTFTDSFPANLNTAGSPSTTCTGGSLATSTSTQIVLTGASLLPGSACTVSVPVTSSVVNNDPGYLNEVQLTSTNGGSSQIASDILAVQTINPSISILKEVATSPTGPWASTVSVAPDGDIYYRLIIENTGDVPLSSVNVTDTTSPTNTTVDTAISGCTWPSVLPVASSTQDPTATCIKGPFTAVTGTNENTATAHGTYNGTVYNSQPKTATYSTTSLSLDKSVSESSYSSAGDALHFTYTITNLANAPLTGNFNIFDTNTAGFICLLEGSSVSLDSEITLAANNAGTNDTIVCAGIYSVTAFDVSVGSVTNTAYALVGGTRSNSDRVTVYVNKPDLIMTKTNDAGGYATKGTAFNWIFKVTNQGPAVASFPEGSTILSDQLPVGATYLLNTINPTGFANITCAIDGSNKLSCTAGTGGVVIPAINGTFTVSVGVTPNVTGSLVNSAAIVDPVISTIEESNEGNNSTGDAINVSADADLSITKTDNVAGVAPGATVAYTIVVSNDSLIAADGAVFTDPVVSNLTVNTVTCDSITNGAVCPDPENITVALLQGIGVAIPTLPGGSTVTFSVTGTAAASGSIVNTAYINPPSGISDLDPSNNAATDTNTIGTLSSNLIITKTDNVDSVTAGGSVSYTIVVSNSGPTAADGAVFTDPAVSNLTVNEVTCGSAAGNAVCPTEANSTVALMQSTGIIIPALPSGGSVTFTVTGTAGASGSIANTASIAPPSGITDPTPGNNTATDTNSIDPSANLSLTKSDGATNVTAGSSVNYTILVSNAGPSAADGAIFSDPAVSNFTATGVTCGSVTGSAACPTSENTTIALMQGDGIVIPTLPSGGSLTFTVTGSAGASGSITNTAVIAPPSGTTDPTPGNNTASDTNTIDPSADLLITKSDGAATVIPGGSISYSIVVSNAGPSSADGAVFTDPAVSNLTVSEVTCGNVTNEAVCPEPENTTVALMQSTGIIIPTLPNGASVTFTVSGTAGASGSIINTANIALPSGTADPTATNNTATDTNTISAVNPALSLSKTASPSTYVTVGETIEYTYTISNTGDVVLSAPFIVQDDKIHTVTCPATPTSLAATETIICSATHSITQADLNAGSLVNTATASGFYNSTTITSAEVSETINANQSGILGLSKQLTSGPTEVNGSPGVWQIAYQILVENYGNITLSNLQVTDDLATTFTGTNAIGEESEFTITTLSSVEFDVNWPGYDGRSNTDLLAGTDTLEPGNRGYINLVVLVTPVLSGTYENVALGSADMGGETTITDQSHNGNDPDPDGDKTPGDDNDPTPVTFSANLFDPPSGIKIFDDTGLPLIEWTAVWINNSNIVAISAESSDAIPEGSSFYDNGISSGYDLPTGTLPAGTTNTGVRCLDSSVLTGTTYCYYEGPTTAFPRGRIIWQGNLGDDFGATNEDNAEHEISIIYVLQLDTGITSIENIAEISVDTNNNGTFNDQGEASVSRAVRVWPAPDSGIKNDLTILPQTGFPPAQSNTILDQPAGRAYNDFSTLTLIIPALQIQANILGVPLNQAGWDVTWLGDQIGWLNGSAYPTWSGNSILTGHVWNALNQPGVFYALKNLNFGDKIQINAYGRIYTYELRENRLISSSDLRAAFKSEDLPWLTLLTCEGFDEETNSYSNRRIVRAVLVKIE